MQPKWILSLPSRWRISFAACGLRPTMTFHTTKWPLPCNALHDAIDIQVIGHLSLGRTLAVLT